MYAGAFKSDTEQTLTEIRKFGLAKSTAMAACFGPAFSAFAVAPQKAEAFAGFFEFSTEACYNRVAHQLGASGNFPAAFPGFQRNRT